MKFVFALLMLSAEMFAVTNRAVSNRIDIIIITPPEVLLSPGQKVQRPAYAYDSDGSISVSRAR